MAQTNSNEALSSESIISFKLKELAGVAICLVSLGVPINGFFSLRRDVDTLSAKVDLITKNVQDNTNSINIIRDKLTINATQYEKPKESISPKGE